MNEQVKVSDLFNDIMAHTMRHVSDRHGEQAMHRLFFELYSHTFTHLEREFGFDAVREFWESIADSQLSDLENLMKTKGFKGMEEYWRATCGQEGADYEMDVTDDSFTILVKSCPPTNWFKDNNLEHYHRYCEHCNTLYRRVGERCGFQMEYIPPDPQKGTCCGLRFTEKSKQIS